MEWSVLAIIAVVALFLGSTVLKRIFAGTTNRQRAAWGQEKGLLMLDAPDPYSFADSGISGVDEERLDTLITLPLFQQGVCHNFQEGKVRGQQVKVFDHRYLVSARHRQVIEHSIVAVGVKTSAPKFDVRPNRFWDNLALMFGYHDIEVGILDIDNQYHISSPNEDWIRELVESELKSLLLQRESQSFHHCDGYVVTIRKGPCSEEELEELLDDALGLAEKVIDLQKRALSR